MAEALGEKQVQLEAHLGMIELNADGSFKDLNRAINILEILVGFNTSSSHSVEQCLSNVNFVNTLRNVFEALGLECTYSDDDEYPKGSGIKHASLVAKITPADDKYKTDPGGFILSSHTDVVPAPGTWDGHSPFKLKETSLGLEGRGAVDMKQAILNMLTIAKMYAGHKNELKKPIYLALSWGEEIGCKGIDEAARLLIDMGCTDPDLSIINEPTGEQIITGHKGAAAYEIEIQGKGGHSSEPYNWISALKAGTDLLIATNKLQDRYSEDERYHDNRFAPPYPVINVGKFNAGDSLNTIPDKTTLGLHLRPTQKVPLAEMLVDLHEITSTLKTSLAEQAVEWGKKRGKPAPDVSITEKQISYSRALPVLEDKEILEQLQRVFETMNGKSPEFVNVGFATDAGGVAHHFPKCHHIVYGTGSLNQGAHVDHEYITRQQLERGPRFLLAMIAETCCGKEISKPGEVIVPGGPALETALPAKAAAK